MAVLHILGSIVALIVIGFAAILVAGWMQTGMEERHKTELSLNLGIPIDELEDDSHSREIIKYSAEKFSEEHFVNRFSDLCGTVVTIWGWFSSICQIGILGTVIWFTVKDGTDNAIYSWLLVALALVMGIIQSAFSFLCKLITGRFPGQAKRVRKFIGEWVRNNAGSQRGGHA